MSSSERSGGGGGGGERTQNGVTLRKKFQPRHRSSSINRSIKGIVKASRYVLTTGGSSVSPGAPNVANSSSPRAAPSVVVGRRTTSFSSSSNGVGVGGGRIKHQKQRRRNSLPTSLANHDATLRPCHLSSSFSQLKPSEIDSRLKNVAEDYGCDGSGYPTSSDDDDDNNSNDPEMEEEDCCFCSSSIDVLNISAHSGQNWVADGVDFSASMEVYLFER